MPILTDEERIGTSIGKYHLESMLGEGGMGVVFAATNTATGRLVAIKLLRDQLVSEMTARKRFEREARSAASLQHPNVVDVLDLGTDDGATFIVLELLQGEPLANLLERTGPLSPKHALGIMLPIMDALAAAHEQGFAHRDLKPDNIFLARGRDGNVTPKLLDFGLAKPLMAEKATQLTATGSVFGTPGYMAPEQAQGLQGMDHVFDLWAAGVILFECLTGRMPFEGLTAALLMNKILSERAPRVRDVQSEVPAPVAKVVDRALQQRLSRRHPDVRSFIEELEQAIDKAGIELPRIGVSAIFGLPEPGEGPGPSAPTLAQPEMAVAPRRNRAPWWMLAVAVTLAIAGVAYGLLRTNTQTPDSTPIAAQDEVTETMVTPAEPAGMALPAVMITTMAETPTAMSATMAATMRATAQMSAMIATETPMAQTTETETETEPTEMTSMRLRPHTPADPSMTSSQMMGGLPPLRGWTQ